MSGYSDCDHWGANFEPDTPVTPPSNKNLPPVNHPQQFHTVGYHELGADVTSNDPSLQKLSEEVRATKTALAPNLALAS